MDVTEHPTPEGKVYLAVVLDAWSRRVVGWSIADHIRSELVVDALQMAIWRRRPPAGQTVAHSDHGRPTRRGPSVDACAARACSGSMGSIGDCFDNSVAESFFGTLQLELLDEHRWDSRQQLALAIFDWIEAWYNPRAPAQLLPDAQPRRLRSQSLPCAARHEPLRRRNDAPQILSEARNSCGCYDTPGDPSLCGRRPTPQPTCPSERGKLTLLLGSGSVSVANRSGLVDVGPSWASETMVTKVAVRNS